MSYVTPKWVATASADNQGSGIQGILQFGETRSSWVKPNLAENSAGFVVFDTEPSDQNVLGPECRWT